MLIPQTLIQAEAKPCIARASSSQKYPCPTAKTNFIFIKMRIEHRLIVFYHFPHTHSMQRKSEISILYTLTLMHRERDTYLMMPRIEQMCREQLECGNQVYCLAS